MSRCGGVLLGGGLVVLLSGSAPSGLRADDPGPSSGVTVAAGERELSGMALEVEPPMIEAGATRSISFEEVLEIALAENVELKLARAEEQIAHARSRRANGMLVPELRLGAGSARTDGRVQGSFGQLADVKFDTVDPTVSLTYSVNLGARVLDSFAARSELDAATYAVLNTRQRLLLRIAELYNDLALAQVGVRIAREQTQDGEQFLRIAEARRRTGIGLGSDVARARAELARDRQGQIRAREIWEASSVRLAVTLRLETGPLLVASEPHLTPLDFASAWQGTDLEEGARHRPDVNASRKRATAAARRFTSAWWDLAGPEINAELRETWIGENTGDLRHRRNNGIFVGWTLSLDKIARIQERDAERTTSRLESLRREDRAAGEARTALSGVRAAAERLPLAWDGLEAAQENHRISLAQFKSGTAIALVVLDAADLLAQSRLDVARSIVDYNLSQVRLLAATGVLEPELLEGSTPR